MKKLIKNVLLVILLGAVMFSLTGCSKEKEKETKTKKANASSEESKGISEDEMKDLSDEEKIEHAIHGLLRGSYGEDLDSAKIYVDKMYTAEEAKQTDGLKDLKLGEKDIAFEVSIHLQPVEGADIMKFTVPDGVYDEETGWVSEIYRLGILKYNSANKTYSIDQYGTGW